MDIDKKNYFLSKHLLEYYSRLGVKYAFISPGSRNTPITLALSDQKKIKAYSIIDERSSGYIALGLAKLNKYPILVITTSGTAVANLFPSIIEAYMSNTPMIILTADRPKKLIGTGANQTIYQSNIFNNYVNCFFDLDRFFNKEIDANDIFNLALETLKESMGLNSNNRGPVHINIPFDKPLYIKDRSAFSLKQNDYSNLFNKEKKISNKINFPDIEDISRPIIVCTDICDLEIILLAENYNIPIFMECRSLRFIKKSKNIISSYDFMLSHLNIEPDIVFRFGVKPISNKLNEFLDKNKKITYLVNEYKIFNDDAQHIIGSNAQKINEILNEKKPNFDESWSLSIIKDQKLIESHINSFFNLPQVHEGYIINKIISGLPFNSNLMIGNSSPIRDLDKFTFNIEKGFNIFSNRGASGIDGIISTAIGISIDKNNYNALIIGDISFFYDISSLINKHNIPINLTIFILNNKGGHIFDQLDGVSDEKEYKKYWLTPINLDIKNIASSFNCGYKKIDSSDYKKINSIVKEVTLIKGIQLVEIIIDSDKNQITNQAINKKIKDLLV